MRCLQQPCIVLLGLLLFNASYSQDGQIRFEHITSEQGLSENVINSIYQDSRGFMWIGTNDGLNRYDGYNFSIFSPDPEVLQTINSNLIHAITVDNEGNIWIGTTGSGLNQFNPQTETFKYLRHDSQSDNSLSHDHITSLYTDQAGRIWIGTINGVNVILPEQEDGSDFQVVRVKITTTVKQPAINSFIQDNEGHIWVGSNRGLYRSKIDDQNGRWDFQQIKLSTGRSENIRSLKVDQFGRLILGTNVGLFYQTQSGFNPTFKKFSTFSPRALIVEGQSHLWAGTYQGLIQFHLPGRGQAPQLKKVYNSEPDNPYSLNKNVVKSLLIDQTGIIWVGTVGGGLNKFDPKRKPFFHHGNKLLNNGKRYSEIRSILEDSYGNFWVGTEGGGLFRHPIGHEIGDFSSFESIQSSARVFALAEVKEPDGKKVIYVGSEDRSTLQRIIITEDQIEEPKPVQGFRGPVFSILQDRGGVLWLGTYNKGLWRWMPDENGNYQKDVFDSSNSGLVNNIVRVIYEDHIGNIWVGTGDGLHLLEADQTKVDQPQFSLFQNDLADTTSLSHNYILDIVESYSGDLWIGTFGGGLNRLSYNSRQQPYFKRYQEKDGLPNNTVKGILEDDIGNLWLTGNRGLAKFDPIKEQFISYSTTDGLQSAEFFEGAKLKRADGTMIFGGVNGFNIFSPESIQKNDTFPKVVFTKLMVHNQEVLPNEGNKDQNILSESISTTKKIVLQYGQNDFSLEFAALHYADPAKNKYAYRLEGYHSDWIEVSADKRYATFTNLRHGDYTLKVRASNSDGVWAEVPASMQIVITPPFWLSWPAYFLYAALIIIALWLFRRYTIIGIHEKHQLTLQHLEREKLEELNQMKLRFFTNISHEFRTPLTLIISPLELILKKGKTLSTENLQQQYRYMYQNAKYLLRLVNQLLDFRKLDQGSMNLQVDRANVFDFLQTVTQPFQFLASKEKIALQLVQPADEIYSYLDRDVLEKVIYNLLSNAFKFTPSGGYIKMEVREKGREEKFLEISVRDNGIGISRNQLKKIFDRFYKEGSGEQNKDGAGIGLAYTKSLVELHLGTITVESSKGNGACFTIQFPKDKGAYLKAEIKQEKVEQYLIEENELNYPEAELDGLMDQVFPANTDQDQELLTLLFVDDHADIRRFIKEGLQGDFRVILAEDGEQANEIALSSLPDIIVSDVMMPRMNGIELCRSLKSHPLTSHIPVVLLTAKSADEDELEGRRTGADAYVPKPFNLDILRAQLLNIYAQKERMKKRFRQEILLQPEEVTVTSSDEDFLQRAVSLVEDHMSDSEFNVEALIKEMHLSRSKFYLKLKGLTGQTCSEFIRTIRLKRAIQLLEKSDYTIKEIMFMTGFNSASYFSKCFKRQFGVIPSEYLRQQKTMKPEEI